MAWEIWVQSQVESYQRLRKWYLMPPCLTLNIIRYRSRVKWSNLGKGVAPSSTTWRSRYWKVSLRVTLDYGCQLYLLYCYISNNLTSVIYLHTVCSIWHIDRTLSGVITPGSDWPETNGNEGVLHIPEISKAGASLSDGLMSYLGYSLGRGVLPLCSDVVGVFCSPIRLGWDKNRSPNPSRKTKLDFS